MRLPGLRNIETAKQIYERLDRWKLANEVVSSYFQAHPDNTDKHCVVTKVVLVNGLYSANIKDPMGIAEHILGLPGLDKQLKAGDVEAIDLIADADRHYVSFASKYGHFHKKSAFPMCDKYVENAMGLLLEGRRRSFRPYSYFFEKITAFREQAGLGSVSWEDLDKYLWLYGQWKELEKGNEAIGKEVKTLYKSHECPDLFDGLEP